MHSNTGGCLRLINPADATPAPHNIMRVPIYASIGTADGMPSIRASFSPLRKYLNTVADRCLLANTIFDRQNLNFSASDVAPALNHYKNRLCPRRDLKCCETHFGGCL